MEKPYEPPLSEKYFQLSEAEALALFGKPITHPDGLAIAKRREELKEKLVRWMTTIEPQTLTLQHEDVLRYQYMFRRLEEIRSLVPYYYMEDSNGSRLGVYSQGTDGKP